VLSRNKAEGRREEDLTLFLTFVAGGAPPVGGSEETRQRAPGQKDRGKEIVSDLHSEWCAAHRGPQDTPQTSNAMRRTVAF